MKKYIWALLFFTLLLTGCGEKNEEKSSKDLTLSLWTAHHSDFWEALGREFDAQTSDHVKWNIRTFENDQTLQKALVNQLAEGHSPDIIFTHSDWIFHNPKKLFPYPKNRIFTPEKYREMFFPVTHHLLQNQNIWGVPISVLTLGLIYHKADLSEKPLAPFSEKQSLIYWEDLENLLSQLNQKDNSPSRFAHSALALGDTDSLKNGFFTHLNILFQKTGFRYHPSTKDYTFGENKTFSSFESLQKENNFFESFSDPTHSHYSWNKYLAPDPENLDLETFAAEKTSIIFGFPQDIETIKNISAQKRENYQTSISPLNIGWSFFPQFKDAPPRLIGQVYALAVPFASQNRLYAWNFLTFASKKENQRAFFLSTQDPPALKELENEFRPHPIYRIWGQQIPSSVPLLLDQPILEILSP